MLENGSEGLRHITRGWYLITNKISSHNLKLHQAIKDIKEKNYKPTWGDKFTVDTVVDSKTYKANIEVGYQRATHFHVAKED